MAVFFPNSLIAAWVASSLKPKQLSATFVVKATYRLKNGAAPEVIEDSDELDAPKPESFSGDRYADDDPTKQLLYGGDFAPFKPRADLVVLGVAHAPAGTPVRQLRTAIHVGKLSKVLTAYGKRAWRQGLMGRSGTTEPEPFVSLPLAYDQALGGPASRKNPVGVGATGEDAPRIEDPRFPILSPRDAHDPAGFAPISAAWLPRAAPNGSYRGNWTKERWPWLPADFDYGYFNMAPRDQQIDGYLGGDEELRFENLHTSVPDYRCRLPGVRVRCFALIRGLKKEEQFREVPMNLDTLWIDMAGEKMVLIWRGLAEVRTPKMKEVEHVLAWHEPLTEPRKSLDHYRQLLAEQLHPAAEDEPQAPEVPEDDWEPAFDREIAEMKQEIEEAEKKLLEQSAAAKAELIAAGADPSSLEPPPASAPIDYAALLPPGDGLTPEELAKHEQAVAEAKEAEAKFAAMDQEFEKEFPEPPTREELLARAAATGDLSGLDLSGMDLSGQKWPGINLSNCDLGKTNFAGSELIGANLRGANLSGANLAGVNFSRANLDEADLNEAILEGAILTQTSLNGTTLAGLSLAGVDFSGSSGRQPDFNASDLSKACMIDVNFYAADFSGCKLAGANCVGARLERADFDGTKAPEINFEGAELPKMNADPETDFTRANFKSVVAPKASFEGTTLDRADFSRAKLNGAQFGDASLREANFDRADMSGAALDDAVLIKAKLTNANLLRANLERADLTGADLRGSNLYEAGLWEARLQDANLDKAIVKRTLLES
jgi:uncharacterized protein YjbI with pentapeptide repeats